MATEQSQSDFDNSVRCAIYEQFVNARKAPTPAEIAAHLFLPLGDVKSSFRRLGDARVLVLQPESGEIMMANPLSAVPTPFIAKTSKGTFWGNCIWDAMGVIAMLGGKGSVETACGCCSEAMTVNILNGSLLLTSGVVHFAIPAAHWWDDIVFN